MKKITQTYKDYHIEQVMSFMQQQKKKEIKMRNYGKQQFTQTKTNSQFRQVFTFDVFNRIFNTYIQLDEIFFDVSISQIKKRRSNKENKMQKCCSVCSLICEAWSTGQHFETSS